MSYSLSDTKLERQACINHAIAHDDDVQLHRLADLFALKGEDEQAEALKKLARKAEQNNWAYDEHKDNEL